MIQAGSLPVSWSTNAIIAAVVVLPWAPVTTIDGCAATSSARKSARGVPAMRPRCAVETTTSKPSGGRGSPPRSTSISSSVSMKIVSCASQPRTSAPSARAMFAYADIPEPPIPTKYSRRPSSGSWWLTTRHLPPRARATSSSAISSAASGRASASIASRIPASRAGSRSSSSTSVGHPVDLRVGHHDRPSPALEVAGVERLVVGGRVGVRDEDRRRARRSELPDRPAGARDREVGRGQRLAEVVGLRRAARSPSRSTRWRSDSKSRSPQTWRTSGPPAPHAATAISFSERAPASAPKTATTGPEARDRTGAALPPGSRRDVRRESAARRPAPCRRSVPGSRRRGTACARTARRAGWRARDGRRPRSTRPGYPAAGRRAPSARRRSPPRRERRRAGAAPGCAGSANGAADARQAARSCAALGVRGRPETGKVSSSKPASGTSRDSTRSGVPANVTVSPRARSASPTASAGLT